MTAARQRRKLPLLAALGLALAGAPFVALGVSGPPARADYIVVDRNSGLAIGGFDAVAYFVDGAPVLGRSAFELSFAGVVWRFYNAGNRAAFKTDPDIYMPRFGGYDPVAVARGVGVAGNPYYWLISAGRLYLFYSADARTAFAADAALATIAERRWPSVQLTLWP
jgi:hypothetical protein